MRRFTKNNFFIEKNPTIVNFPVKNLKLQDIVPVPTGALIRTSASPAADTLHTIGMLCDLLR